MGASSPALPPVEPRAPHHLAVGSGFACIIRESRVLCTGRLPWDGQVARAFAPIEDVAEVTEIVADDQTLCALTLRGDVWCRRGGPEDHADRWLRFGDALRIALGGQTLMVARRGARLTVAALDEDEPPFDIRRFDGTADLAASLGVACGLSRSGQVECVGAHVGSESRWVIPGRAIAVAFDLGLLQVMDDHGTVLEQNFIPGPEQVELSSSPYRDPIGALFTSCAISVGGDAALCPSRDEREWTQLPVGRVAERRIAEVARNFSTACALDDRGELHCWGDDDGILGRRTDSPRFEDVLEVTDATDVVVGESHGCALLESGQVTCWGGTFGARPRTIVGLDAELRSSVRSLASTDLMVCALGSAGQVVCWGRRWPTEHEALEGPERYQPLLPLTRVSLPPVDEITAAAEHMCARAAGRVSCWREASPLEVSALRGADHIAGAGDFLCGAAGGALRCAPLVEYDEDEGAYPPPTEPRALGAIEALSAGPGVVCWAIQGAWSCAAEDPDRLPTSDLLAVPRDLAVTAHRSCAVAATGLVQCIGLDENGELALRRGRPGVQTTALAWLGEATGIALSLNLGCVVLADGRVRCWGPAGEGALGSGRFVDVEEPVRVGEADAPRTATLE